MIEPASTLPLLGVCMATVLLLHGAVHDAVARTIPDQDCALLALLGLATRLWHHQLLLSCGIGGAVFAVCHLLWWRGWLGGGDAKLIAACCTLVAPGQVAGLLAAILCAGGVLGLAYLAAGSFARRLAPAPPLARHPPPWPRFLRLEAWRLRRGAGLPYGIAVAAAALFTLTTR